jgi:hypothetical protein
VTKNKSLYSAGWWVIDMRGKEYILTRKTEEGSVQVVSSFDLGQAIRIAASLGGKNV